MPYTQIQAHTCREYKDAILKNLENTDILIFAAALPTWQIAREEKTSQKLILTLKPAKNFLEEILPKKSDKMFVLDLSSKEFSSLDPFKEVVVSLEEILKNKKS